MDEKVGGTSSETMVERLEAAVNSHDLEALVACFAEDYENETPAHPGRNFRGKAQVRQNWTQIFHFVPDLQARVTARSVQGNELWTEWEHQGTRRDGTPHLMRGVVIFTISAGLAVRARFYLEPVEHSTGDVDAAVRRQVVPETRR